MMLLGLLALAGEAQAAGLVLLDQSDAAEEDRFHEELALSLPTVHLREGPADFSQTTLADQLDVVRPMLEASDTSAVAWLDASEPTLLRVSVAFVESDRAIVRVLDMPREPGAEARLALATRELLSSVYAEEIGLTAPEVVEVPVEVPTPASPWSARVTLGGVATTTPAAGGLRGGFGLGAERAVGGWAIGGGLETQLGASQWRVGPVMTLRREVLLVGARADWTQLDWTSHVQPRVFVGLRWPSEGLNAEVRATLAPIRDEVFQGKVLLYDSGRAEFSINLGWARKVGGG